MKLRKKADRVKTLKRKLWTVFSQYIRKSHADHAGYVTCCDTGQKEHWTAVHCGHLFANTERNKQLGGNELWYYEKNFAPQSAGGNMFNSDDSAKNYMLYAIKRYGVDEVERMKRMKQTPKKWTEEELEAKLTYYQSKL